MKSTRTIYSRCSLRDRTFIASVRRRNCTACLLSSIHFEDKYGPSQVSQVQRGIRTNFASFTQMTRSTLVLSVALRALPGAFTGVYSVAIATRKTARRRAPSGPARCLGPFSRLVIEAWKVSRPRLPSYARSSPKIPVYTQATSPANAPARRRENDEERHREIFEFDDASTRIYTRLVAPTLETRVSFYFLLRTRGADFSGIRLQLGSAKGPDPPESSSTSRIPPLRSIRLRVAPFSFFNFVGEQSPDRSTENRAARSTVRDDSVFRRNRGTGAAKLNGSNNRTSLSRAKSCTERNVATCRIKARLYHRHN